MAERLRNLGRYTFADIVSYRLDQTRVRSFAALGSLTVVCCYLVVQMVGAGQLIKLLFGLDYSTAVVVVGALMLVYVIFGGMLATTCADHQGGTAAWRRHYPGSAGTGAFRLQFRDAGRAGRGPACQRRADHGPRPLLADPINAVSLSLGLVFGIAGLPHILMRFFTVPNAREARRSVLFATLFIGFFFLVVCALGYSAIVIVGGDPQYFVDGKLGGALIGGGNMVAMHLARQWAATCSSVSSPPWPSPPFSRWSPAWPWPAPRPSPMTSTPRC